MRFLPATVGALLLIAGAQPLAAQTTSKLRGDVNGDGQITSVDALAILSYTVGKSLPAEYKPIPNGDNNGDGQVTALDALIALSFIVGKDVAQFPINKPLQTTAMVEISPATAVVLVGQDAQLTATPRDSTGATMDAAVTWTSSDEAIATVDANGKVTAKGIGVAIITATADGKSSSITVAGDQIVDGTVAVSDYHACAVTTTGSAICWGRNTTGELGDGTKVNRSTPVTVSGGQKWKAVAVAPGFSCGLTTAGAAYCWGYNGSAGLGDGSADVQRLTPSAVSGGRVYQAISAGQNRVAAITDAGALYGWGYAIGDGTTAARLVPTAITAPAGVLFKTVSVGSGHSIALSTTGAAYAWGGNEYGQVGDGTTTQQTKPVAVSGSLAFRAATAGVVNSVAVTTDGKAYTWGAVSFTSATENRTTPMALPGSLTVRSVHTGSSLFIGLSNAGTIYTWNGGTEAPARSSVDRTFRTIASTAKVTVGAMYDGSLWSWGYNDLGQLGDGSAEQYRDEPGLVGGTLPTSRVTVTPGGPALMYQGATSTVTVTLARSAFTGDVDLSLDPLPGITGSFDPARLTGAATTSTLTIRTSVTAPVGNFIAQIRARPVGRLDQFAPTAIVVSGSTIGQGMASAGGGYNCGLTTAGKAYCVNALALSPTDQPTNRFEPVPGGRTFATITSGDQHACALTPEGAAYCWGNNAGGALGVGSTEDFVPMPTAVTGGLTFRSINAEVATCGITTAGDAYCWGTFIGDTKAAPTLVPGGIKFHSISVGGAHVLALAPDGTGYAWGENSRYQLGGVTGYTDTPVKVSETLKFISLDASGLSSGGITADGGVYMWGEGVLGIDYAGGEGTSQIVQTPTKLVTLNPVRQLSVGNGGSAAVDTKGGLWWWGEYMVDGGSLDQCITTSTNCGVYVRSKTPRSFGITVSSVSAGGGYSTALTPDGELLAWGINGGIYGDGSTNYSATPTAQPLGFTLTQPNSPIWIEPGKTVTLTIRITRLGGFTTSGVGFPNDVTFSLPGTLPDGVTATINPATLGPEGTTATITITASSTATPGQFSLDITAKSPGVPDQVGVLKGAIPKPVPAAGLDLVCSPANFTEWDYHGYYCMNANGVLAPGKYAILPLHTPVGGSQWWVEGGSEVCVQWDANNGNTRVRYSGGITKEVTEVDGRWGVLVKRDGTPEIRPGNTWFLYTSAMDPQLQALSYIPTFSSGQSPVLNYNFQKKACPW